MPYDGSGNFTIINNFEEDRINGVSIDSLKMDNNFDDIANGLSNVMLRSGSAVMAGILNMGDHKITNLVAGASSKDAVNKGQMDTALSAKQATITGGASTITSSNLTANRALVSSSSGKVAVSAVTATELGYLSGVTSAVQTQINGKQATITGGASTITGSNLTASRALVSNSSGKVAVSAVTSTELGYLDGVTSAIQTQLNAKATPANITSAINTLLSALYPVGSLYITTNNSATCPLESLISGSTWSLVAADKALWTSNRNANTTIAAGLPNITGSYNARCLHYSTSQEAVSSGALYQKKNDGEESWRRQNAGGTDGSNMWPLAFDASRSNSIYGSSSTVQPPAYRVNVWRRTA